MSPFWADPTLNLTGRGAVEKIDPGTGAQRYQRALDAIRQSGKDVGFASFTFDVDEDGSVLLLPEQVEANGELPPPAAPTWKVSMLDDGVAAWRVGFEKSMLEIETGRVEKVVLARKVELSAPNVSEGAVMARLAADNPDCYLFSIDGLIGASPELLVELRDGVLRTLALAGTATDPEELSTDKISEEHRHVSLSVERSLSPHLASVDVAEKVIVPQGAMSHVGTRIEGPAAPGTTVANVLRDLHPTAAVAGHPNAPALDLIREIEPSSRGRYSGPVGWMNTEGEGVFAIALRCGTITADRVTLYAGGGLVAGSTQDDELAETEMKLAPMLRSLGYLPI